MKTTTTLALLLLITACAPQSDERNKSWIEADVLYHNGTIWTATDNDASVLAVKGSKIVYAGDDQTQVKAERTVDLAGKFLMPGFIDNHVHFFDGGFSLASVDLRDAATPAEFKRRIAGYAADLPQGRWVLNGNWDHTLWGGELPHRSWIDEVTPNTPVFVMRLDGHMGLANSAALKLAKVDATTPTPEGGEIVRDENGEPTGVLKDSAMLLVQAAIPAPTTEELMQAVELAQDHALSLGLTEVHAMSGNPTETWMRDAFQTAKSQGRLKLRVKVYSPVQHWQQVRDYVAANGRGDSQLSWDGVKGLVDGSLGSATAWFYEPYSDDAQNSGFPLIPAEQLTDLLGGADRAGLKLAIHAIGDKAIDSLLATYAEIAGAQSAAKRFRIEHYQHPSFAAIKRLAEMGVIASSHPYHAIDDGRWAEEKIGPERIKSTYAFKSILDAGGILSFGSDWPVAPLSPLAGVYAAVTRRTIDGNNPQGWQPQEKISVAAALKAYTINNAYAGFSEQQGGTLEVGKRADFVLLEADPRDIDPATLEKLKVLATVINGETQYGEF